MFTKILLYLSAIPFALLTLAPIPFYGGIIIKLFDYSQITFNGPVTTPLLVYLLIISIGFYLLLFWWRGINLKRVLLTFLVFPLTFLVWIILLLIFLILIKILHGPVPIPLPYSNWLGIPAASFLPFIYLIFMIKIWGKKLVSS